MTNFKPNLQIKPEKIIIEKPSLRIQMEDKKIKYKIEKIVDKKIENKISER
jgi:formaldehyde-activating enzyme involved in methanogenesis